MCGIAGFTWPDRELARRMADAVAHRGPDDSGVYTAAGISLGHRRLSIIDPTPDGHQPISNEDGSVWLVFNGEIYNYRELRRSLESSGHVFRGRSDSEVIVHAYEEYGLDCLPRLRGMFAFAIWDGGRRRLLLARDRLGIKPLYYASTPGGVVFASEIKGLLECPVVSAAISPQAIYHFIGYEFVPEPGTIFEHVRALEPACWLTHQDGRIETGRYWHLQFAPVQRTRAGHEALLRETLQDAVRSHLVSDVPVGVFLSGGLDSSAIVAAMSHAGAAPIRTYSLGYADRTFSELEYARLVSRAFGTTHQELIIDPITPDVIERAIWHLDQPMSDLSALPFYLLCKAVRTEVKVCLSGEGGDETLVGYDRFKASKAHRWYSRIPEPVRRRLLAPLILQLRDRPGKKAPANVLKRFVEGGLLPADGEHMRWQYFSNRELEDRLLLPEFRRSIRTDPFAPVRRHVPAAPTGALDRELAVETGLTMVGNPLFKADRMSMAHGLEVRVPMLDHRFVAACATIPAGMKLAGFTTKAIFRTAMRGVLPPAILRRRKQGYSAPIKHWLRGPLREYMIDTVLGSPIARDMFDRRGIEQLVAEHDAGRANHNHILWALLNLAVWHRQFVQRQAPASPLARRA